MMNIMVALVLIFMQKNKKLIGLKLVGLSSILVLVIMFVFSERIMSYAEEANYGENVLFSQSTPYQRITITGSKQGKKLYLNGNLQFNSADEYRYHEALIHPSFCLFPQAKEVLILGGGDGCAAREVLKYKAVNQITLVDLDPAMTKLFTKNSFLKEINQNSFLNSKVKIYNTDAFIWLKNNAKKFDIIIIDLPDPSNYSLGKLYSNVFYAEVKKHMHESSVCVVQSTSPYVAPNSYWCIVNTIRSIGMQVLPYHNYVPSFGDWGYILFSKQGSLEADYTQLPNTKFFDSTTFVTMMQFSKDIAYRVTDINQLNNQALVNYFEHEWSKVQ